MEQLNEYKNIDEIKKLVDNDDSIKDELIKNLLGVMLNSASQCLLKFQYIFESFKMYLKLIYLIKHS